ncbi:eukaryotic translation initiation factor 4B2-like [Coffea arabica]|uniref:Eukaryotic translation initiation factor 4B2-like n=1 Tax=Coffea arabica TaxID=13443 RepID=A0A6P6V1G7_COFAR
MSNSPWGNIGAWAADSEREEEELRELAAKAAAEAASADASATGGGDSQSFPSLRDAVSSASKQTKKKTKMSLQEFTMQNVYGSTSSQRGLTHEEMLRLPTGPKERSAGDEMQYGGGRLGGGFSNYGVRSGGPPPGRMRDRDSDGEGSWGGGGPRRSYGGFEDDRRRGPPQGGRGPDFDQPSRADEVDNWGAMKKPLPSFNSGPAGPGRPSRYASLGGGSGGLSRADEVDNWGASKKPIPPPAARSSSFGSGFRGDFKPEPEKWTRDGSQERQRLVLDPPRGEEGETVVKVNKPNPFGAARPREEVLAEKGLDWKKLDSEIEAKKAVNSRPASSQSSRPGSSQSARSEGQPLQVTGGDAAAKPRPKVNPFGDAKPREVLLEEKGLDWRKIDLDLEHRRVDRLETEEEKNLKEEIEHLKKESLQKPGDDQSLHDQILQKEKDLELLIRELDDKVRFGPKPTERPGSGAGRLTGHPERPHSQPAAYEEPRGGEFMDRPRSRGTGDAWARSMDDRRAYHGGRSRGFLGNRDTDRSTSKERW